MFVRPLTIMRDRRKPLNMTQKHCGCIQIHYGRIYLPARACLFFTHLLIDWFVDWQPRQTASFKLSKRCCLQMANVYNFFKSFVKQYIRDFSCMLNQ